MSWVWAAASRTGTSHLKTGLPRQDAYRCLLTSSGQALIIVACDGAGSASHGGAGAQIAARTLSYAFRQLAEQDLAIGDDAILDLIDQVRDQISATARHRGLAPRDFATTLVLAIASAVTTITVHIGDGAIVGRHADTGQWQSLSWPEHGEYASTTYFLTDDAGPRVRIIKHETPYDRLCLFTDGIERLALDFSAMAPFGPFFTTMTAAVAASTAQGPDHALSAKLGAFLDGEAVNSRTDDDKTLILACHRPA